MILFNRVYIQEKSSDLSERSELYRDDSFFSTNECIPELVKIKKAVPWGTAL
jgi:hypothetical protein